MAEASSKPVPAKKVSHTPRPLTPRRKAQVDLLNSINDEDVNAAVDVDLNKLTTEWRKQAPLVLKVCLALAEAKLDLADAKNKIEMIKASTADSIRKNPEFYDLAKTTDAVVADTVIIQPEVQEALKAYNNQKFNCDTLQALVDALDSKKKGLESCTALELKSWYANPNANKHGIPTEMVDQYNKTQARTMTRVIKDD